MKLKIHREDVKDLKLMHDPHVQAIAERYRRLIRAFEQAIEKHIEQGFSMGELKERLNIQARRVLKDAEGK